MAKGLKTIKIKAICKSRLPFCMVYLYVEKIPQFYWGLKKALAKTEKAGKRPPKNVEEKLNLQV